MSSWSQQKLFTPEALKRVAWNAAGAEERALMLRMVCGLGRLRAELWKQEADDQPVRLIWQTARPLGTGEDQATINLHRGLWSAAEYLHLTGGQGLR